MRVFVVDSEAARELVDLTLRELHGADACLSYDQIQKGMKTCNEMIRLYLTDPPEFESMVARTFLGEEEVTQSEDDTTWSDEGGEQTGLTDTGLMLEFITIIDEAVQESAYVVGLDIMDLDDVIVGDTSGIVLLMI